MRTQEFHIVQAGKETTEVMFSSEQGAGQVVKKKKHTAPNEKDEKVQIQPRDLKIAWGSDSTQWKIDWGGDAEAIKVMWFEVKATYRGAKAGSKYNIGFNISLKSDAFGWDSSPVFLMAKVGDSGSYTWKKLHLNTTELGKKSFDFPADFKIDIPISAEDTTLLFGLYEIWGGRWKGGLSVHHAFVSKV